MYHFLGYKREKHAYFLIFNRVVLPRYKPFAIGQENPIMPTIFFIITRFNIIRLKVVDRNFKKYYQLYVLKRENCHLPFCISPQVPSI